MTAFVFLMKALDKLQSGKHVSGFIILLAGSYVLFATIFHNKLKISHYFLKLSCYCCEFLVLLLIAYLYFENGKMNFVIIYGISGMLYLFAAFMWVSRHRNKS